MGTKTYIIDQLEKVMFTCTSRTRSRKFMKAEPGPRQIVSAPKYLLYQYNYVKENNNSHLKEILLQLTWLSPGFCSAGALARRYPAGAGKCPQEVHPDLVCPTKPFLFIGGHLSGIMLTINQKMYHTSTVEIWFAVDSIPNCSANSRNFLL